jgi:hypothetical protein
MGMKKKLSLMVIGLSAFLLTPCAASDALPETETELYAAFPEENDAAYEDYAGYQFSGDDPWEGILTITVRSIADGKTGMIRVSFGIYNTAEEVDAFLEILPEAMKAAEDLRGYGNVNPDY